MATDKAVKNVFIVHRLVIQNNALENDLSNYTLHIDSLIATLLKHGKHVVYLYSVPEARINPQLCGSTLPFGRKADLSGCSFPLGRELEVQRTDRALVATLKLKYPQLAVFDPSEVLCEGGVCRVIRDGKSLWMDDNHVSESASYLLGKAIVDATVPRWSFAATTRSTPNPPKSRPPP